MEKQARTPHPEQGERAVSQLLPKPSSDSASAFLGLIERVAVDPGAEAKKLDRIMAMYETLKAKEAELAYNAAKGRILKKLAGIKIVKNRSVLNEINGGMSQKNAPSHSNTRRWRRSTNICARSWRKRRWISPTLRNPRRAAVSGSAAV